MLEGPSPRAATGSRKHRLPSNASRSTPARSCSICWVSSWVSTCGCRRRLGRNSIGLPDHRPAAPATATRRNSRRPFVCCATLEPERPGSTTADSRVHRRLPVQRGALDLDVRGPQGDPHRAARCTRSAVQEPCEHDSCPTGVRAPEAVTSAIAHRRPTRAPIPCPSPARHHREDLSST